VICPGATTLLLSGFLGLWRT